MNAANDVVGMDAGKSAVPRTPPHPTHKLQLLLRREFWEHKGGFLWAPLVAGGIFLLLSLMGFGVGEMAARRSSAGFQVDGQGIRVSGIDFFQDLLSLEPGDQWEKKLYEEIDKCDLFLLFWSTQGKCSPWVMKETAYALARQKKSAGKIPRIMPIIIEGPPPPSPPDELRDIHFNDYLIYILAAIQAQPPKPAG